MNIDEDDIEYYGCYKAKLSLDLLERKKGNPSGKLIL
jgi:formate--tetrahydrofolate ligase